MHTTRSRFISVGLLTVCLGATLSLTSCSGLSTTSHDEWKTTKEMAKSADGDRVPSLVATDAKNIRFSAADVGSGLTVISWQSKSGITRSDCKEGSIDGTALASVPNWWPKTPPEKGWSCGWWRVFQQDGTYYSWQQLDSKS